MSMIKMALIKPEEKPILVEVENCLESFQKAVDGLIEFTPFPGNDELFIYCNEEGKVKGLPFNRPLYDESGELYDVVAGDFIVLRTGEEGETLSLTDEDFECVTKLFEEVKTFVVLNHKLYAFPFTKDGKRYELPEDVIQYVNKKSLNPTTVVLVGKDIVKTFCNDAVLLKEVFDEVGFTKLVKYTDIDIGPAKIPCFEAKEEDILDAIAIFKGDGVVNIIDLTGKDE